MQFDSWESFVAMGGYGFYVWLAFGVTAVVMAWLVIDSVMDTRRLAKQAEREAARTARIQAAKDSKMLAGTN